MGAVQRSLGAIGVNAAGGIVATLVCAILGIGFGNISPRAAVTAALAAAALALGLMSWRRYDLLLGYAAAERESPQRRLHDQLKDRLTRGARVGDRYGRMLTSALSRLDILLGDSRRREGGLWQRIFGLEQAAPLWTASSYDRCLLIALLYPIIVLFGAWVLTGAAGPAEQAMGLQPGVPDWRRVLVLLSCMVCLGLPVAALFLGRGCGTLAFVVGAVGLTIFLAGAANTGVIAVVVIVLAAGLAVFAAGIITFLSFMAENLASSMDASAPRAGDAPRTWRPAGTMIGMGSFAVSVAVAIAGFAAGAPAVIATGLVAGGLTAFVVIDKSIDHDGPDRKLTLFLAFFSIALFLAINLLPLMGESPGPLLLFIGLLTVVNAPFDWLTIGLTRALLRRGLEKGGWWPLWFGILDLVAATFVIFALGVAILLSVQLFNAFTEAGGAPPVLDVDRAIAALADRSGRAHPENWWLYAMLFSTTIPSIVNVSIGALSILRGVPAVQRRIGAAMTDGRAMVNSERIWMAPALAAMDLLSWIVAPLVMGGVLWIIFLSLLPVAGIELLEILQALAAEDLPDRLVRALGFR